MVKKRHQINEIISKYKNSLAALGIKTEKVVLYGSYAYGQAREGSDIDLIVISPDFADKNLRERLELLGIASARIMEPIQALGYTSEELEAEDRSSFIREILEYGKTAA
ncbi:MAG: nucleotidyltransferase domain-containing protein [Deltaproteobacteria bacterium]|nr:nucleotidyltransferase domain-containing protein [Deltaproteobacteria bacterium]